MDVAQYGADSLSTLELSQEECTREKGKWFIPKRGGGGPPKLVDAGGLIVGSDGGVGALSRLDG